MMGTSAGEFFLPSIYFNVAIRLDSGILPYGVLFLGHRCSTCEHKLCEGPQQLIGPKEELSFVSLYVALQMTDEMPFFELRDGLDETIIPLEHLPAKDSKVLVAAENCKAY